MASLSVFLTWFTYGSNNRNISHLKIFEGDVCVLCCNKIITNFKSWIGSYHMCPVQQQKGWQALYFNTSSLWKCLIYKIIEACYSQKFAFGADPNVNTILDVDIKMLTQVCVYPGLSLRGDFLSSILLFLPRQLLSLGRDRYFPQWMCKSILLNEVTKRTGLMQNVEYV